MHHPTEKIAHTTAFVKPVVEHWGSSRIDSAMGSPRRIDPTIHRTLSERSYHGAPCDDEEFVLINTRNQKTTMIKDDDSTTTATTGYYCDGETYRSLRTRRSCLGNRSEGRSAAACWWGRASGWSAPCTVCSSASRQTNAPRAVQREKTKQ